MCGSGPGRVGAVQLLIIRHAQSANNKLYADTAGDVGRLPDPDITDLGYEQADALARAIVAGMDSGTYPRITHVYSSLMRRTIQTIAPLADALDLPITARTDAHEFPGPFEGPHDARVPHPGSGRSVLAGFSTRAILPDSATEDGWFSGELEDEAGTSARAAQLLEDLRRTHQPDDVVALATHGWFGSVLISTAIGANPTTWFMHHNTGTTMLVWEEWIADGETESRPQVTLRWTNRTDHLEPGQLTM